MPPVFLYHFATPGGEAAVRVIELHGDGAAPVLERILRFRSRSLPGVGEARLGEISDGGRVIDEAVVQRVPGAGMWCGTDAWILTVHGGDWVSSALGELLARHGGEERGAAEILRLSVACGALDAVQAAAAELLASAPTEAAAAFLARQHAGELSEAIHGALRVAGEGSLEAARQSIRGLLEASPQALRLCRPLQVLLAGRPNAGKSTLFNRWAGRELAAVTRLPGTTRDLLEVETQIDGYPLLLIDGAGDRPLEEVGEVERAGILRARSRAADAVVYLVPHPWGWTRFDGEALQRFGAERCVIVASQADLGDPGGLIWSEIAVSPLHGHGLDALRDRVRRRWIDSASRSAWELPASAFTDRQIAALERASLARGLDDLREASIECLRFSWPATPQHA